MYIMLNRMYEYTQMSLKSAFCPVLLDKGYGSDRSMTKD